jgi:hypothetical protein
MQRIWVALAPSRTETRVIATHGSGDTLLKARLSTQPKHPRALSTLLDGIALWEGRKVHAALTVDEREPFFERILWGSFFVGEDTPLFELDVVPRAAFSQRRRIVGMGDFATCTG